MKAFVLLFYSRETFIVLNEISALTEVDRARSFGGWQIRYEHQSFVLDCKMTFSVYLPPQAEEANVSHVYWLSGLTCDDQNFVTKAGAQRYAAEQGLAIIAPVSYTHLTLPTKA